MEQYRELTGTIQLEQAVTGTVQLQGVLSGTVQLPNLTPPVHPTYDGDYTATPHFHEQKLETKNKLMTDNVTIEIIPAHEVTNPSGGLTVTIG